jgi:ribonucleoside-triphosphate reductase
MKLEELTDWIEKTPGWEYVLEQNDIKIHSNEFETNTLCSFDAVEKSEIEDIVKACHHGKNVKHMTRITGYFSVVEGWNKGKIGELKDRYRNEGAF